MKFTDAVDDFVGGGDMLGIPIDLQEPIWKRQRPKDYSSNDYYQRLKFVDERVGRGDEGWNLRYLIALNHAGLALLPEEMAIGDQWTMRDGPRLAKEPYHPDYTYPDRIRQQVIGYYVFPSYVIFQNDFSYMGFYAFRDFILDRHLYGDDLHDINRLRQRPPTPGYYHGQPPQPRQRPKAPPQVRKPVISYKDRPQAPKLNWIV